jgi:glycosyltransferase involved in cell wall biosynthesis
MANAPTLSLIVITRDEEAFIGQCLSSAASFCNEIVVVDSVSTDRTVEIAKGLGAQVYEQPFTNYVKQKQIALDHATSEWVLLLDADEQATFELGREIESVIRAPHPAAGYRIQRTLYHLNHYYTRPIYRDRPVRLFRRQRGHIGGIDPHDKVIVDGRVDRLKAPILHFSYRDVADHVATMNRFSTRAAAETNPAALSALRMFTHPLGRFINFYIVRGGFREGGPGLYAAMSAAFYVFLKYAKVYERRVKARHPR